MASNGKPPFGASQSQTTPNMLALLELPHGRKLLRRSGGADLALTMGTWFARDSKSVRAPVARQGGRLNLFVEAARRASAVCVVAFAFGSLPVGGSS
jgi:hypothetical protein